MDKMQPSEIAKILGEMLEAIRLTVKEKNALRAATEIVRNHDVVHAEWIKAGKISCRCGACNYLPIENENYCPNCGAKMGERKDGIEK
jgi:Zn finger protein HypA/HybF involved in hydrogenase expression